MAVGSFSAHWAARAPLSEVGTMQTDVFLCTHLISTYDEDLNNKRI